MEKGSGPKWTSNLTGGRPPLQPGLFSWVKYTNGGDDDAQFHNSPIRRMDFPWESFSSIPGEKGGGCNDPPSRVEKYSTTFRSEGINGFFSFFLGESLKI